MDNENIDEVVEESVEENQNDQEEAIELPEEDDSEDQSEETPAISIRQSIKKALSSSGEEEGNEPEDEPTDESVEVEEVPQQAQAAPEKPLLVPPADMNAAEKDAYLNPTPANAHILQQYMNRRAYETRADYQRRVEEVESLRKQTSSLYDTIKEYESVYAKDGINLSDVARRSIAWDREMQKDPVSTAIDWLDSYGLSVNDLLNASSTDQYQQQPSGEYLTREEAARIADERLQAAMSQREQEQQRNAVAYYNDRAVESFVASKPLFRDPETASQLEAEMAPIVQALSSTGRYSSPEQVLETAYNYVVSGNPAFSSLHSAMTAKPKVEQRVAEAQKAKAASRSISGSAGSGTPRIVTKDIRDNLRRRLGGE